jgi:hypothetical protein
MGYITALAVSRLYRIESNGRMIHELERFYNEGIEAYSRYYKGIFLEGLRKTTNPAHSQYKRYRKTTLLGAYVSLYRFHKISLSMDLQPFGPWPFFQFLSPTHNRQDSLDRGSARRKAAAYTQNKCEQTFMPRVWFEPTIPVFELAETVHALDPLDHAATVIGY